MGAREHTSRAPRAFRRRADPVADAAASDEQHLQVCDVCAIVTPIDEADRFWNGDRPERPHCGAGYPIGYERRGEVPTLQERLARLRARLAELTATVIGSATGRLISGREIRTAGTAVQVSAWQRLATAGWQRLATPGMRC